ncbi:phosphoribosyltransferase family protein [Aliarcobacter lanthieri]|uniref:phosphoribosyltransferase family protein n=1 Tax=Aliarcobacter lanthieri TaxID=1355374 RepID=UPI00047BFF7C|nr:phosphoribosyltransferase family protein [Aliarcobacter lanthieri]QKF59396.1 putative phosphoribosyltransferase [Aliarcobacter lanthieri]
MNQDKIFFKNREEAALQLLDVLPVDSMKLEEWIVIGCSYGGYEMAKIIAEALNADFDIMFSQKIFAPNNEDCEIAVVTELEEVLIHEELVKAFDINLDAIYSQSKEIYDNNIKILANRFRKGEKFQNLLGKNVLIIDEDINVGLVMMACIKTIINQKVKSLSVATPILSTASIATVDRITDDLYYIKKLDHYIESNYYYDNLEELTFEDIERIKNEGKK